MAASAADRHIVDEPGLAQPGGGEDARRAGGRPRPLPGEVDVAADLEIVDPVEAGGGQRRLRLRLGRFDGRAGGSMRPHEWLEIRPAKYPVNLAYLPQSDFFRVLRQKLKWSGASV